MTRPPGGRDSSISSQESGKSKPEKGNNKNKRGRSRSPLSPTHNKGVPHSNPNNSNMNNVPLNNSFNINENTTLADVQDDNMTDVQNTHANKRSNTKTAPIVVVGTNVSTVHNLLSETVTSKKYEIKIMNIGIRINTVTREDFDLVCNTLQDKQINFYKYHTPETKPRKIVLFGLPKMKTDDLSKALSDVNVHPKEIKMMRLNDQRSKSDNAVYLLYFEAGTTKLQDLKKIKHISNVIVRWEAYQPRGFDQIPQCRKCQMYGHSSINCNMPSKCMVCSADHLTENCDKKKSRAAIEHAVKQGSPLDRSFIKCANCNQNHTANYRGCSKRKEFITIQQKLTERRRPTRRDARPTFQYNPESFPPLNNQPTYSQPPPQWGVQGQVENTNSSTLDMMMQMMCNMNQLLTKLFNMIDVLTARLGTNNTTTQP